MMAIADMVKAISIVFAVVPFAASSAAYCVPLDDEMREICRRNAEGDPVEYKKCEARFHATSQASIDWSVKCYDTELSKIKEAAAKRGMSLDEVPDNVIFGAILSCERRNPYQ